MPICVNGWGWLGHHVLEGSGLSRDNRLSAIQLDQVLSLLEPHKDLLKHFKTQSANARVFAKTGTLDGVQSYAGFIDFPDRSYRFVFLLNRTVAYGFRDKLLEDLVRGLHSSTAIAPAQ